MLVLNFSHPLTDEQVGRIAQLTGQPVETVLTLPTQFEPAQPFNRQVQALIDQVPLRPEEWQTAPMVVVLPSLNNIAAMVVAELHGRMGYFPSIARLGPAEEALPPRYEVIEVINLQAVRDAARKTRISNLKSAI